ncbi:CLUMA_CG005234, isoform A [Clunio marinus]|uniref:CLUMA_CG005234, isoform A n=1 Tax=Clunio marinus TaxID=568069 RepID=A0A1J1HW44_9DIPT|nr:CLUMA_CG005234, isoform A [Clunio marinus]
MKSHGQNHNQLSKWLNFYSRSQAFQIKREKRSEQQVFKVIKLRTFICSDPGCYSELILATHFPRKLFVISTYILRFLNDFGESPKAVLFFFDSLRMIF